MYRKEELPREGKTEIPREWKAKFPGEWKIKFPTLVRPDNSTLSVYNPLDYVAKTCNSKGDSMVKQKMYLKIKALKKRGYSNSRIARDLKIDRKTVRKYMKMDDTDFREYLRTQQDLEKLFFTFTPEILAVYKKNDFIRLPMASVYDYLEEKYGKLPATEKSFRNYIHYLENNSILIINENVRMYKQVPELPYGKQLQIDFGEYKCKCGLKLYIFAAVLSSSRYKYIRFQDKPFTTLALIDHLLDCFLYIEGMPEEIVIDQDSIMVVSENYGDIIFTKEFKAFIQEMNLKMYVCRKADPETKGKIENVIKFVKTNFLACRTFESLEEANERLMTWLTRRGNGKISQATKKIPAIVFEEEKKKLRPVRNSIFRKDSHIGREERLVDEKCLISVSGSHYSVPQKYRNKKVEIYRTEKELYLFDIITNAEIGCHQLSIIPGQKVIAREHYRQTEKKARELKDEVLKLFGLERWRLFMIENFKTFPRYTRDQCIQALKHFKKGADEAFLDHALKFCLASKTFSIKDLIDTYDYYKSFDEEDENVPSRSTAKCLGVSEEKKKVCVATRELSIYEDAIKQEAAV